MLLSRSKEHAPAHPHPAATPFFSAQAGQLVVGTELGEHIVGNACSRSRACSSLSPPSCSSTPIFVPVSGMVQRIIWLLFTQLLHQVQLWLHLPCVGGMGMKGIQSLQQISQSKRFSFHGHGTESMPEPRYVVQILQRTKPLTSEALPLSFGALLADFCNIFTVKLLYRCCATFSE